MMLTVYWMLPTLLILAVAVERQHHVFGRMVTGLRDGVRALLRRRY